MAASMRGGAASARGRHGASSALAPKYDVLELKYADGSPAVLRQIDGTGFAYYPSGRKAICISAFGVDSRGKARRFSAVVHEDAPRSLILGIFDEWGKGYAEGMQNVGDTQPPKILITERSVTVIDGAGKATEVPHELRGTGGSGSAEVALRVNHTVSLQHRLGRTTLAFQAESVRHTFVVGELQGDEVPGMVAYTPPGLKNEDTIRRLEETHRLLDGTNQRVAALRVDPSQKDTKLAFKVDTTSIKDVLDNLTALTQKLAHPALCHVSNEWGNELGLKKLLATAHPQCAGQSKGWTVGRVGGRCTDARLAAAKATVATPKTLPLISQLRLPELVEECAPRNVVLVVVCLASYAQEQCAYAKLLAERTQTEVLRRLNVDGAAPPVRFVAIELSEITGFAQQYGIREAPYCLMFSAGRLVYSKRISGMRARIDKAVRPQVLLVEPDPANQLKLERALRRNGFSSDLAMDAPQAQRLASRRQAYGVLLISSLLRADQIRAIASSVRQREPNAVILGYGTAEWSDEDPESRGRISEECVHTFARLPSYTGLATVLSRFDHAQHRSACAGDGKEEFVEEVLAVVDSQGRGANSTARGEGASPPPPAEPVAA